MSLVAMCLFENRQEPLLPCPQKPNTHISSFFCLRDERYYHIVLVIRNTYFAQVTGEPFRNKIAVKKPERKKTL